MPHDCNNATKRSTKQVLNNKPLCRVRYMPNSNHHDDHTELNDLFTSETVEVLIEIGVACTAVVWLPIDPRVHTCLYK